MYNLWGVRKLRSITVLISDECASYLSSQAVQRQLSLEEVAAERLEVGTQVKPDQGELVPTFDYLELVRIAKESISNPRTTEEIDRDLRSWRDEW